MDKSKQSSFREKKTEGLVDLWKKIKSSFDNASTVGDRLEKRRKNYPSNWDKIGGGKL